MINGVGIDLIEINRIKKAHKRWGDYFLKRVFNKEEIEYCLSKKNPYPHLAVRFAAKEAGFKAFSQAGINHQSWQDLWVVNDPQGIPILFSSIATEFEIHLSLSHSNDLATAIVIIEK